MKKDIIIRGNAVIFDEGRNSKNEVRKLGKIRFRSQAEALKYVGSLAGNVQRKVDHRKVNNMSLAFSPWSEGEVYRFLKVAGEEEGGVVFIFALETGMRLNEVLALRWGDIDFAQRQVTIRNHISLGSSDIRSIKTSRCSRTVSIPSTLLSVLENHRDKQKEMNRQNGNQYDLVFTTKEGGIQRESFVQMKLKQLTKKAGVGEKAFHDLRIMNAYLLYKKGVVVKLISERLGHKDIKSTLNYLGE